MYSTVVYVGAILLETRTCFSVYVHDSSIGSALMRRYTQLGPYRESDCIIRGWTSWSHGAVPACVWTL